MQKSKKIKLFALVFIFWIFSSGNQLTHGQSVSIDLSSSPIVEFEFNTIQKLTYGIAIPNAAIINIEAVGTQWDLYVGSVTAVAGTWDNSIYYTSSGNGSPPVSLLQLRVHNLSNTPQISGYVPIEDIATSTLDIIGNHLVSPDPAINCADLIPTGTNTAGSYTVDPQCYQFRVDLKVVPGITYRPGLYSLQVEFIIAEDL
jgi:hypothetical protein